MLRYVMYSAACDITKPDKHIIHNTPIKTLRMRTIPKQLIKPQQNGHFTQR